MLTLGLGIASLAALLGFLVGASESPVAGIAITATFGIVATILSAKSSAAAVDSVPQKATEVTTLPLYKLGQMFIVFSIAFVAGLSGGIYARLQFHEVDAQTLPWEGKSAPKSARQAVDWIIVGAKLRSMGYSNRQVLELYEIDVARRKDEKDESLWRSDELISPLLESKKEGDALKKTPFMAWDPNPKKKLLGPRVDG